MVFALLTRHWLARRHYPFASWAACIACSLRVLLFRRAHVELLTMDIYRHYVTQVHDDVFHHLSHRNYLARGLSLRQRVRCVLTHHRFEDATFDAAYKHAVYRDGGLVLWQHEADGSKVEVRLGMAQRLNAEGDLTLTLLANGRRVHRLSFSWVDERFAGLAGLGVAGILPFIARNQGHRADETDEVDAFRRAFAANSPPIRRWSRRPAFSATRRCRASRWRWACTTWWPSSRRGTAPTRRPTTGSSPPPTTASGAASAAPGCRAARGTSHSPSMRGRWRRSRPGIASGRRCGAHTGRSSAQQRARYFGHIWSRPAIPKMREKPQFTQNTFPRVNL
ncbi:DUF535 family protein [Massilia kyonggiensis]|nr:DUF535 family protein [Massilia kyonggiensis]